jgi:hypothetical protein
MPTTNGKMPVLQKERVYKNEYKIDVDSLR